MSDFYEDRAHELGFVPEDEDLYSKEEFDAMLKNKVYTLPRPYVTEDQLAARSQHVYQGPSANETMDNLREDFRKDKYIRPVLVLQWKVLLTLGGVCIAGAVWALVAILKDLQP